MMTLIDTSAWIEFFRAKGNVQIKSQVVDLIAFREAVYTCPIRFELFQGARVRELPDLRAGLGFAQRLTLEPKHWDLAADLAAKLRSSGQSVPVSDLLIAIVAHEEDLCLLARDQHFEILRSRLLPGLRLLS